MVARLLVFRRTNGLTGEGACRVRIPDRHGEQAREETKGENLTAELNRPRHCEAGREGVYGLMSDPIINSTNRSKISHHYAACLIRGKVQADTW